jgi:hypothetical protein
MVRATPPREAEPRGTAAAEPALAGESGGELRSSSCGSEGGVRDWRLGGCDELAPLVLRLPAA